MEWEYISMHSLNLTLNKFSFYLQISIALFKDEDSI
jgi:hypothetical protein